jgi:hypothetical protein
MRRLIPSALLASAYFAFGAWAQPPDQPPPRRPPAPRPEQIKANAAGMLMVAYETIAAASAGVRGEGDDKDLGRLLDAARDLYRNADKAYKDGAYDRAAGTAMAADAAGSGIMLTLQANAGKLAGVPAPPADALGPPPPPGAEKAPPPAGAEAPKNGGDFVQGLIKETGDRLDKGKEDKGPGATFLDAARKALDQAKQAQKDGDAFKAVELVHAADAWGQVGDLLRQAEQPAPNPTRPPPGDR